jgi:hypothetical protein
MVDPVVVVDEIVGGGGGDTDTHTHTRFQVSTR